jgi:hypothetical protein
MERPTAREAKAVGKSKCMVKSKCRQKLRRSINTLKSSMCEKQFQLNVFERCVAHRKFKKYYILNKNISTVKSLLFVKNKLDYSEKKKLFGI